MLCQALCMSLCALPLVPPRFTQGPKGHWLVTEVRQQRWKNVSEIRLRNERGLELSGATQSCVWHSTLQAWEDYRALHRGDPVSLEYSSSLLLLTSLCRNSKTGKNHHGQAFTEFVTPHDVLYSEHKHHDTEAAAARRFPPWPEYVAFTVMQYGVLRCFAYLVGKWCMLVTLEQCNLSCQNWGLAHQSRKKGHVRQGIVPSRFDKKTMLKYTWFQWTRHPLVFRRCMSAGLGYKHVKQG